jgi:hypothetical protein
MFNKHLKNSNMLKSALNNLFRISTAVIMSVIPAMIHGQVTSSGQMPQYLYPEFSKSDVLMKGGRTNTAQMNYNIVSEKMVFISNDNYYDLTNPEQADTVFINGAKFVPVGKSFYEVLVTQPIALFFQHKGNLMSAGKPVGYGGTSQTASANYISSIELSGRQTNLPLPNDFIVNPAPVYWIRIGDKWSDFTNEKQFLSLFPGKSSQIKSFIKDNRIKIEKPDNLVKLVKYCAIL